MAHWAQIDPTTSTVQRVTVGDNADPDGGYGWLVANLGGTWLQCSYNTHGGVHDAGGTPLRLNYPGPGWTYDTALDGFIPPQPYPSWTLDHATGLWVAPVPMPTDGKTYVWSETSWTTTKNGWLLA